MSLQSAVLCILFAFAVGTSVGANVARIEPVECPSVECPASDCAEAWAECWMSAECLGEYETQAVMLLACQGEISRRCGL